MKCNNSDFRREIATVINRFSRENGSDTPDYVLAIFIDKAIDAFDSATRRRTHHYGFEGEIKRLSKCTCPDRRKKIKIGKEWLYLRKYHNNRKTDDVKKLPLNGKLEE